MSLLKIFSRLRDSYTFYAKGGVAFAKKVGVKVGKNCRIYTNRFGKEPYLIEIGNNVTITSGVIFLTHDGSTWLFRDEKGRRYVYKRIRVGNNVFIGVNSIIMPGVIIEDNVIIGAGSIVTKSVPAGSIAAGNPARIIGDYNKYKETVLIEYISEVEFKETLSRKENIINFANGALSKPMINNLK